MCYAFDKHFFLAYAGYSYRTPVPNCVWTKAMLCPRLASCSRIPELSALTTGIFSI